MSFRNRHSYVLVASGSTVSEIVDVRGFGDIGVSVPTVTSGSAHIQVAAVPPDTDPTSADFVRLMDGSGDISRPVAAGDVGISFGRDVAPWPHARVEFSVAQTDNRTLQIVVEAVQ